MSETKRPWSLRKVSFTDNEEDDVIEIHGAWDEHGAPLIATMRQGLLDEAALIVKAVNRDHLFDEMVEFIGEVLELNEHNDKYVSAKALSLLEQIEKEKSHE